MKKFYLLILLLFNFRVISILATAPTEIILNYNFEKGLLHIEAFHTSYDLDDHYLRILEINKNGKYNQTLYFTLQMTNAKFIKDIPLKVESGDKISVKFYCSEGGSGKSEYIIPEKPKEE